MAKPIEWEDARRLVLEHAAVPEVQEVVPLERALGRRLARDLACDGPWPTTDRSAMDGFALGGAAGGTAEVGRRFAVVGEALAGHPFAGALEAGQAVRIMTGAVVPAGADRVAKVEDTSGFEGRTVELTVAVDRGANIRPIGSEHAAGSVVLRRGARIRAAEVGALAVLGQASVPVAVRPRVAILATGDEVVGVGASPAPHQVRDSNSWALAAKVIEAGGEAERLGIVADDEGALRAALERGLAADVLITIGGVSKGTHDLVHGTLAELGVVEVFHGVRLKPGKPTFFGRRDRGGRTAFVFGLPGNPASAFTTFDLFVLPLLCRLGGGEPDAGLIVRPSGALFRSNQRAQVVPARLTTDAAGGAFAELAPVRPSGDPFGLLAGAGYGVVPPGAGPEDVGTLLFLRDSAATGSTDA